MFFVFWLVSSSPLWEHSHKLLLNIYFIKRHCDITYFFMLVQISIHNKIRDTLLISPFLISMMYNFKYQKVTFAYTFNVFVDVMFFAIAQMISA